MVLVCELFAWFYILLSYCNEPKFSDSQVWANSVEPNQIDPRGAVWSGSALFAILSEPFGHILLW